jgi:hypothetical protein
MSDLGNLPRGPLTAAFKRELEQQLTAQVPPGKRGALLTVLDENGVQVSVAAALDSDGDWKLAGNVSTEWGGDLHGKVVLSGAW